MRKFVAVDVETSGLNPEVYELIEVGLVIPDRGEFEFSVPFDESRASLKALEVNGWGKRQFAPQVDPVYLCGFLQSVLNDVHLVGKNPSFDAGFLWAFIRKHSPFPADSPPWHHRLVDVGCLAWGWDCSREIPPWSQPPNVSKVAEMMDIPLPSDEAHTALGDARWACKVFSRIMSGTA